MRMNRLYALVALVVAVVVLTRPADSYFLVTEGVTRCFLQVVPEETLVVGKYKNLGPVAQNPDASNAGIEIFVEEPTKSHEIFSTNAEAEGRFAFTSHDGGEHRICLTVNSTTWFGTAMKFKFDLQLAVGEKAIDYDEMAKVEHLTAIEVEIRKLTEMSRGIRSEQLFQRGRERQFRDTSESTNARVMWWSLFQTIFLVGTSIWQIYYLKSFFMKKKLV